MDSDKVRSLSEEDYRIVSEAYLLRTAFNEGKPGWDYEQDMLEEDVIGNLSIRFDEYLARLAWLRFWIQWALVNCDSPPLLLLYRGSLLASFYTPYPTRLSCPLGQFRGEPQDGQPA